VRERTTQYLNDCNDFLKSFDPSVLLTAGVSTILLMATQTDTFYNTPTNIRSRRVLDAKITDGATDRQTSKLTASARQIVGHLQGFVNDIDAGVYSQRTLYPLPSAVRSYSKLLDPTVLNKRYQDARTGIKTVNKTVNKLENGRKMHAKEVDELKNLFRLMETIQDIKISQADPTSTDYAKLQNKKKFLKDLHDEVTNNYNNYVGTGINVSESMEHLFNLSHMPSNDTFMMGGSGDSSFKNVQKNVNQLNHNRKQFYDSFKRTVQEYAKTLESM
jgi:hypothetical protein